MSKKKKTHKIRNVMISILVGTISGALGNVLADFLKFLFKG